MKRPNKPSKQPRLVRDKPRKADQLQIGLDIPGTAEQEVPRKRRLAPFDNGRIRNSFWGFDGPDGEVESLKR